MECRLQSGDTWSCSISLHFDVDTSGTLLPKSRIVQFGPKLTEKTLVEATLRRAQRAILRPSIDPSKFLDDSDIGAGGSPAQSFSTNRVCINVEGPAVPDLSFYDLPGICSDSPVCVVNADYPW